MKRKTPKQYHMLYLLEESYYYIAAGKDVPKSQIAIMQTQLDRLKEKDSSGTSAYERIMKTYLKGAAELHP